MKYFKKRETIGKIIIIAIAIIIIGLVLFGTSVFATGGKIGITYGDKGYEYSYISTPEVSKEVLDAFSSIEAQLQYRNIKLIPAEEFAIEIMRKGELEYSVENDILKLSEDFGIKRNWGVFTFGWVDNNREDVYIYYPKDTKFDIITLNNSTSSLSANNLAVNRMELENKYGVVTIKDSNIKEFRVNGKNSTYNLSNLNSDSVAFSIDYGTIKIKDFTVKNISNITLKNATLSADNIETDSLVFDTSYGAANLNKTKTNSLIITDEFATVNYNGEINGNSKISTNYGAINLNVKGAPSNYNVTSSSKYGTVDLEGVSERNSGGKYTMDIQSDYATTRVNIDE